GRQRAFVVGMVGDDLGQQFRADFGDRPLARGVAAVGACVAAEIVGGHGAGLIGQRFDQVRDGALAGRDELFPRLVPAGGAEVADFSAGAAFEFDALPRRGEFLRARGCGVFGGQFGVLVGVALGALLFLGL